MIYIAFLLFTFLTLAFVFYQWQFHMIFTPTYKREEKLGAHCSLLSMTTDDGIELEGALCEPSSSSATLLYFSGRSHDGVGIMNKLSQTYPHTRIIIFNYRSYGKSGGRVSEKNILSDGLKVAGLVEKNYGPFYMLGYSLGSSVAAYVASHHKVKALFLIGAFDSIASLAKSKFVDRGKFPHINLSNIFRYKFRTGEHMQSVDAPTYLFVSKKDEVTYIQNARELKDKVKNLRYYLEVEDLNHKEILWDARVVKKINEVIC